MNNDDIVITINDEEVNEWIKQQQKASKRMKIIKGAIISFIVIFALFATSQFINFNQARKALGRSDRARTHPRPTPPSPTPTPSSPSLLGSAQSMDTARSREPSTPPPMDTARSHEPSTLRSMDTARPRVEAVQYSPSHNAHEEQPINIKGIEAIDDQAVFFIYEREHMFVYWDEISGMILKIDDPILSAVSPWPIKIQLINHRQPLCFQVDGHEVLRELQRKQAKWREANVVGTFKQINHPYGPVTATLDYLPVETKQPLQQIELIHIRKVVRLDGSNMIRILFKNGANTFLQVYGASEEEIDWLNGKIYDIIYNKQTVIPIRDSDGQITEVPINGIQKIQAEYVCYTDRVQSGELHYNDIRSLHSGIKYGSETFVRVTLNNGKTLYFEEDDGKSLERYADLTMIK